MDSKEVEKMSLVVILPKEKTVSQNMRSYIPTLKVDKHGRENPCSKLLKEDRRKFCTGSYCTRF